MISKNLITHKDNTFYWSLFIVFQDASIEPIKPIQNNSFHRVKNCASNVRIKMYVRMIDKDKEEN